MSETITLDWPQLQLILDKLDDIAAAKREPRSHASHISHRLNGSDAAGMKDAFYHLHDIHENHKSDNGTYMCWDCPLCDQAVCAYSALLTMCDAAGIEIKGILES